MRLIENNNITDPYLNLALEEYCLRNLDTGFDYLLFYVNEPSIVVGKHQNLFQEINFEYVKENGIHLVRRISGGGAVYHDDGNLNFSFITGFHRQKLDYFKKLIQPIIATLHHLGIPTQMKEKNNIMVEAKKISGNSQYTNINRMLSHGTLLFDSDLQALANSLDTNLGVIKSRGIQSIKSDVTNIAEYLPQPMDMTTFGKKLIENVSDVFGDLKAYQLGGDDWDRINQLCENKYKSWDWTFAKSPDFVVRQDFKYDGQDFRGAVHVSGGVIKKIDMANRSGGHSGIGCLPSKLIGERYDPNMTEKLRY
jgi:lipoate-protein ligase A